MQRVPSGIKQSIPAILLAVVVAARGTEIARAQAEHSQTPSHAAPSPSQVYEAGDVYLPGSRVYALAGKTGLGHEHGVVGQLASGRLRLDAPQNSGQLVFSMRSFAADTDAARQYVGLEGTSDPDTQRDVTANMVGAAVLDAPRYPTATFTVWSITPLPQPSSRGLPQYELVGDFTLHGVTQRIKVVADSEEKNGWIRLRGGFTMLQSQFGITPYSKVFGAVGVTDQLSVWGDLWIAKQRQTVALGATTIQ